MSLRHPVFGSENIYIFFGKRQGFLLFGRLGMDRVITGYVCACMHARLITVYTRLIITCVCVYARLITVYTRLIITCVCVYARLITVYTRLIITNMRMLIIIVYEYYHVSEYGKGHYAGIYVFTHVCEDYYHYKRTITHVLIIMIIHTYHYHTYVCEYYCH